MPEGGWVTATEACQCPTDACAAFCFLLSAFPSASPMGFEPTISCVTGRRALQAAPRGQDSSVAQVGVEPTASLVLSQGGLPIAYRAMFSPMPKAGFEPAITRV